MKQGSIFIENENQLSWFNNAITALKIRDNAPNWPDNFGRKLNLCLKKKKKINILSLFSGGGGLDIGFNDGGFNIVESVEIDERFVETLKENTHAGKSFKSTNRMCVDIRSYNPPFKSIDFIIGGPPCQTFSAAGARAAGVKGLDDQRGTLFEEYVRILKRLQPKGFLFENVYRIVGAQNGKPWKLIQQSFQDAGYKIYWRILDAADYGVPQHRERLIIVGIKEGDYSFPFPTHGPDSHDGRPYYSAEEAVKGIDTSGCKIGINGRHGHLLDDIPPGLNYSFYTERMGHPIPIFGWRSKFSDYLYKADPKTPVRTIKAQGGQYTGPFSWNNRPFTIEELKRLQTFPDNYKIVGNRQVSIMQIGNSVPPQLGRILALSVLDQIFKVNLPFDLKYLPEHMELGFRKRKSRLTRIYAQKAKEAITKQINMGTIKRISKTQKKGTVSQSINSSLVLCDSNSKGNFDFNIGFNLNKEKWKFTLSEPKTREKKQYSIEISLSDTHSSILGTKNISLISKSHCKESLVALWKYLEKTVKSVVHKDDLIQLFGYYQYKQDSSFRFIIADKSLNKSSFWMLVKSLTGGLAIGTPLHISEISNMFQMNETIFLKSIKNLKEIGYEIRNHNTNPQLENEFYLIPYQFPTLNERSLQRLTSL